MGVSPRLHAGSLRTRTVHQHVYMVPTLLFSQVYMPDSTYKYSPSSQWIVFFYALKVDSKLGPCSERAVKLTPILHKNNPTRRRDTMKWKCSVGLFSDVFYRVHNFPFTCKCPKKLESSIMETAQLSGGTYLTVMFMV